MVAPGINYELKKNRNYFFNSPLIFLSNLKFVEHKKKSFCRPLDCAARGGRTTRPRVVKPLLGREPTFSLNAVHSGV